MLKFWLTDDMAVVMKNSGAEMVDQLIELVAKSKRPMTVARLASAVSSSPLTVFIVAREHPRLTVTIPGTRIVSASVVKLKEQS